MLESCSNSSHTKVIGVEKSGKSQGIFRVREAGHPETNHISSLDVLQRFAEKFVSYLGCCVAQTMQLLVM